MTATGCSFRVWAPNADAAFVAGTFTQPNWDGGKIALQRDGQNGAGRQYWSAFVPGAKDNDQYRFVVSNGGAMNWRIDPYCRDATSAEGNGIIDDPTYDWGGKVFPMPAWNELVIYELHVGTFNVTKNGTPGSFADAITRLSQLRDLGINAIEVMPAEDFDSETSMGYNPALLFAIDDAYGTEKAVQKFISAAHDLGIAVIFDVVYNHVGPDGLGSCLWRFDGWSQGPHGGVYLYPDPRAITDYSDESRPDYGRAAVCQFLRDNAMMWLHEYRADGLRFDSVVNIRQARGKGNNLGDIPEGWGLLQWINSDKNHDLPWNITIAEDLQDNEWITKDTGAGGAGFDSQWDTGFFETIKNAVVAPADESRDMFAVAGVIGKKYNGSAFQRVIFSESHDEVTVQNGQALGRMPEKIDWGHADSWPARKRSTLAAAIVFTSPGIPMIFQGQEFLEWGTWTDNLNDPNSALDWSKAQRYSGILNLYSDLIKLRRNWYNNTRGLSGQNVNAFHVNNDAKVIAYHRWADGGPGDDVIIIANFSTQRLDSYNIGFPRAGTWFLRFNSDWNGYSGDFSSVGYTTQAGDGGTQGMPFSGNIGVGPYSAIILSQ